MPALGESGVILGALDLSTTDAVSGVQRKVLDVDGWGGPASTIVVSQRPTAHGGWSGDAYLRPRVISIQCLLSGQNAQAVSLALDELIAACTLEPTTLTLVESGRARTATVRRQDEVIVRKLNAYQATCGMQLVADDPRKYGPSLSVSTALPSSSGGLTWPVTWPVTWTGTSVTGLASIVNEGNITAPVQVRFDGPVVGPKVVHVQTGRVWAAAGATLTAGEFWAVDMDRRQVLAQGQASRAGSVTARGWMELQPGPNDFQFAADSYDAAAQMTVTAASAWM